MQLSHDAVLHNLIVLDCYPDGHFLVSSEGKLKAIHRHHIIARAWRWIQNRVCEGWGDRVENDAIAKIFNKIIELNKNKKICFYVKQRMERGRHSIGSWNQNSRISKAPKNSDEFYVTYRHVANRISSNPACSKQRKNIVDKVVQESWPSFYPRPPTDCTGWLVGSEAQMTTAVGSEIQCKIQDWST